MSMDDIRFLRNGHFIDPIRHASNRLELTQDWNATRMFWSAVIADSVNFFDRTVGDWFVPTRRDEYGVSAHRPLKPHDVLASHTVSVRMGNRMIEYM